MPKGITRRELAAEWGVCVRTLQLWDKKGLQRARLNPLNSVPPRYDRQKAYRWRGLSTKEDVEETTPDLERPE